MPPTSPVLIQILRPWPTEHLPQQRHPWLLGDPEGQEGLEDQEH